MAKSSSNQNLSRTLFLVIIIAAIGLAAYLIKKDPEFFLRKNQKSETVGSATQPDFFQKPGAENKTYTPADTSQNKTPEQLQQTVESNTASPSDYNLLATSYYQKGDKEQALKTIDEGLVKFPNNDSLLKTKDLIENILPNL